MTDRTDHRAAAEGELLNAIGYVHDADLSKADRSYQSVNFALIHALLAIHDALNDRPEPEWNFNEVRWRREVMPWEGALDAKPCDCARHDAYAAREAEQREATQEATGGDLSASEGESGAEEGEGTDDTPEALLCPECGHDIEDHCEYCCGCPRSPSGVAYALIAEAVKAERERLAGELRELADAHRRVALDLVHYKTLHILAGRWGQQ